jgi:UDP-N-acetylglucosamine--N-acetylmuramyl-(pentapeptide) pyrophosphoryl-undecaprenol N-acetylglucosamine transferase
MKKRVAVAAAGTGGHVFPAMAVAEVLQQQGIEVIWFGVNDGKTRDWVATLDVVWIALFARPMMGMRLLGQCLGLVALGVAFLQALYVLWHHRIQWVVVFGGYVSAPVGLAAWILRRPLVLHEQNAVAGRANAMLAPMAQKIFTAFPDVLASDRTVLVGNPLRGALYQKGHASVSRPHVPMRVLVLGGSQGAAFINRTMAMVIQAGPKTCGDFEFRLQCGQVDFDQTRQALASYPQVALFAFIDDMAEAYLWADVVIARAGALTIAECQWFDVPALYIPLPTAIGDHQTHNAHAAVQRGRATLMPQAEATPENILTWLQQQQTAKVPPKRDEENEDGLWPAERMVALCFSALA